MGSLLITLSGQLECAPNPSLFFPPFLLSSAPLRDEKSIRLKVLFRKEGGRVDLGGNANANATWE